MPSMKLNFQRHDYYPDAPWFSAEIRDPDPNKNPKTAFMGNIDVHPMTRGGKAYVVRVKDKYGLCVAKQNIKSDAPDDVPDRTMDALREIAARNIAFWSLLT